MLARAGIIGPGGAGSLHADALRRIGVAVRGVAAVSPDVARRDAERLGLDRAYASVDELVASAEVDVVHVCSPNALHLAHCRAALEAGKHIVAEKPLTTSVREAEELLSLAEDVGVVHALCHTYRYYPMVQALRAVAAGGQLGHVHTIHGTWLAEELLGIDPEHWMLDRRQMGPALSLADVGVHWWDLVEHVTRSAVSDVICETRARRPNARGGEDTAVFVLRLEGGAIATGVVCQAAPGHTNTVTLELIGDRAAAAWDIRSADQLVVRELSGRQRVLQRGTAPVEALGVGARLPPGHPEGHADALRELLSRVYEHIGRGYPARGHPTFVDGLRGLRVLEALSTSARTTRWTAVSTGC
ncbi:MAG TPA: Gfo/Idh/MocA family oxidoreductase [Solirubrobacteraceae bacterium]|nr:Gfo/Idh/MocA family oxidoreductase [Solirubrobacteraceae bacterium]